MFELMSTLVKSISLVMSQKFTNVSILCQNGEFRPYFVTAMQPLQKQLTVVT
jgi:hypothetical protein